MVEVKHFEPVDRVAPVECMRTMRAHRGLLLIWFKANKEIALGAVESFNNKAKVTTKKAYGFKSFEVLKVAYIKQLGACPSQKSGLAGL